MLGKDSKLYSEDGDLWFIFVIYYSPYIHSENLSEGQYPLVFQIMRIPQVMPTCALKVIHEHVAQVFSSQAFLEQRTV